MTPLGHASIAFLVGTIATKFFPGVDPTITTGVITLGGVAPDLDLLYRFYQKKSKVFDKTIGKHRFFPSHTPFAMFLVSIPLLVINKNIGLLFFFGTMLHLFIDTLFFPEGINFSFPFSKKMTHIFTIKTHKFWAPKEVSGVENWHINYLSSPLFWIFEGVPILLTVVILLLHIIK